MSPKQVDIVIPVLNEAHVLERFGADDEDVPVERADRHAEEHGADVVEVAELVYGKVGRKPLRWVLAEAGKIRILEPDSLREQLLESARKIIERNS